MLLNNYYLEKKGHLLSKPHMLLLFGLMSYLSVPSTHLVQPDFPCSPTCPELLCLCYLAHVVFCKWDDFLSCFPSGTVPPILHPLAEVSRIPRIFLCPLYCHQSAFQCPTHNYIPLSRVFI